MLKSCILLFPGVYTSRQYGNFIKYLQTKSGPLSNHILFRQISLANSIYDKFWSVWRKSNTNSEYISKNSVKLIFRPSNFVRSSLKYQSLPMSLWFYFYQWLFYQLLPKRPGTFVFKNNSKTIFYRLKI